MKSFEDLRIWQEAREFTNQIYDLTENIKDYGFKDQMQRAAVSVMNNIAEGFDYGSDPMFVKFLDIAKASCGEVKSMLYLAEDRRYCSTDLAIELRNKSKNISSGIHALIKYLKSKNVK
jgi:four helix bundle protein